MRILETPRLALRWLEAADAHFMLELVNDPDWLRYIGDRGIRSIEAARDYIADGPRAMYARLGFGLYLVELKGTDTALGICGLIKRDWLEDVDLGFAFLARFRGNGYACEAASATLDLRGIRAGSDPDRRDRLAGESRLAGACWPRLGHAVRAHGRPTPRCERGLPERVDEAPSLAEAPVEDAPTIAADFDAILVLNEESVAALSPLTVERLSGTPRAGRPHRVVEDEGRSSHSCWHCASPQTTTARTSSGSSPGTTGSCTSTGSWSRAMRGLGARVPCSIESCSSSRPRRRST